MGLMVAGGSETQQTTGMTLATQNQTQCPPLPPFPWSCQRGGGASASIGQDRNAARSGAAANQDRETKIEECTRGGRRGGPRETHACRHASLAVVFHEKRGGGQTAVQIARRRRGKAKSATARVSVAAGRPPTSVWTTRVS